jgi:hypothetical protein
MITITSNNREFSGLRMNAIRFVNGKAVVDKLTDYQRGWLTNHHYKITDPVKVIGKDSK